MVSRPPVGNQLQRTKSTALHLFPFTNGYTQDVAIQLLRAIHSRSKDRALPLCSPSLSWRFGFTRFLSKFTPKFTQRTQLRICRTSTFHRNARMCFATTRCLGLRGCGVRCRTRNAGGAFNHSGNHCHRIAAQHLLTFFFLAFKVLCTSNSGCIQLFDDDRTIGTFNDFTRLFQC